MSCSLLVAMSFGEHQAMADDVAVSKWHPDAASLARVYRNGSPVTADARGNLFIEGEEFAPVSGSGAANAEGWRGKNWGSNYFAATFFNTFLSRKAYLAAPPQLETPASATITVDVPADGRYMMLARYEAPYRFEAQFNVRVEQGGVEKLDRLYGARDNVKIWPFKYGLKKEVKWGWGAVENIVWEGHEAIVDLKKGQAVVTLTAGKQPEPAAWRNVDVLLLTPEIDYVTDIIPKGRNLPIDGMLTQADDVWVKVHNKGGAPVKVHFGKTQEHSPYWVHIRRWEPRTVEAAGGKSSDWVEVGNLMDAMNDGQWGITASVPADAKLDYSLEFAVRNAAGKMESIHTFDSHAGKLTLAYDANTRYTKRIRTTEGVIDDMLAFFDANPIKGSPPKRTIVYCYTFPVEGPEHAKKVDRFIELTGVTLGGLSGAGSVTEPKGYIDVRSIDGEKLIERLETLKAEGNADKVRTVSFGDEIGLPAPPANDDAGFATWAKAQGLKPGQVTTGAKSWEQVKFNLQAAETDPRQFYYSNLYRQDFGIAALKAKTDTVKKYLPNADTGANFSPHHRPAYVGDTYKWITLFRRGGMTMPWSEDYIWQLPVGSQQMNGLLVDLMRAGNRYSPEQVSHFYVMPHWPGNTPDSWRRLFYGTIGGGVKIFNLFEFRPVQVAYTENHVTYPPMYQTVREAIYELASFEDIVQDGQVARGNAGLWYSRVSDAWRDTAGPFGAEKRALYVAMQHAQLEVEVIDDEDAVLTDKAGDVLGDYDVIFLADRHVSTQAAKLLTKWVNAGGVLFATAGAGLLNEYHEPNTVMQTLLGVKQTALEMPDDQAVDFIKQDLPWIKPMDTITWDATAADGKSTETLTMPVIGAASRFTIDNAKQVGTFADGSPAIATRTVGKGKTIYAGFLPALGWFQPSIPEKPVDRGSTDDAMAHFLPSEFHPAVNRLFAHIASHATAKVTTSHSAVQANMIESPHGVAITVVNWSDRPIKKLRVSLHGADLLRSGKVRLASGGSFSSSSTEGGYVEFDLDVADAVIFEK